VTSALAIKVEQLLALGVASASDLAAKLKVSQPSISGAIVELTNLNRAVRMGATRGARYGLRHDWLMRSASLRLSGRYAPSAVQAFRRDKPNLARAWQAPTATDAVAQACRAANTRQ
jgi:hypothetical protein